MNLHDLVRGAITAVHPDAAVTVLAPAGWTVNADHEQVPQWRPAVTVMAQSQPVADKGIQFAVQERDNTLWRDFYFYGLVPGLERASELGGALLYWNGYEWLVTQVLEDWSEGAGWCKVHATQQRRALPPADGAVEPPAQSENNAESSENAESPENAGGHA